MAERPTLHLTNFASRTQRGPRRLLCAMARPRRFEHGDGRIAAATPLAADLAAFKGRRIDLAEYRRRFETRCTEHFERGDLAPGRLRYAALQAPEGAPLAVVADMDTLFCSCPRPDSRRRTHPCHIEWLAPFLVAAGWRVLLYGQEVTNG